MNPARHRVIEGAIGLALSLALLLLLLGAYLIGEDQRCSRLQASKSPLSSTYCPPKDKP